MIKKYSVLVVLQKINKDESSNKKLSTPRTQHNFWHSPTLR